MSACGALCACSLALGALIWPPPLRAQPPRVAVVRNESSDRLLRDASTRLRAELHNAGFTVVEVQRAPGDPRAGVESAANSSDSFATVALERVGQGAFADVWISDRVTGKTVVRRLQVTRASNAASVLAIRALELLRASLLEIGEPSQERAVATAPPQVLAWMAPSLAPKSAAPERASSETLLGVSLVGLHGTGGLGLALGPSLRLRHTFGSGWFGRLVLALPMLGPEPETARGRASVRQQYAAIDLGLTTDEDPFGAFAYAGLGAFHLRTAGRAAAPYHATHADVVSLLSNAGVGALVHVGQRTLLSAELGLLWLVPYPVVVIAGQDAGRAGVPSLSVSAGALFRL